MMIGKPEVLAEMNKKLILDYLRKCGPQSRAEMSRNLGLSFPSVSTNMEALMDGGMIRIKESSASDEIGVGRKPILFEYNADWGYIVAIDLGRYCVRMIVCNVAGSELKTSSFRLSQLREDELMNEIDRRFCALLAEAKVPMEKVCCVSIGMPGIPNDKTGRLEAAPFLHETLRAQRVDSFFAQKYGLKTYMGNSVNLAAIAEKWQGAGVEYSDIVYVDGAMGLGSAIILGDELITGYNGAAGEIAYMLPGLSFRRREYNEIGVLEQLFYEAESERRALMQENGGKPSGAANEAYLEELRDYFAMTLVNLAAMINPEVIIVGGGFGHALMKRFSGYFEEFLSLHLPYAPRLIKSKLNENAALLGAAAYALRLVHDEQPMLC